MSEGGYVAPLEISEKLSVDHLAFGFLKIFVSNSFKVRYISLRNRCQIIILINIY
jgi:hypothetical protein